MPLRFTGSRSVRTGNNTILQGAAAASVSFWLKLHAGSGVVTGNQGGLIYLRSCQVYLSATKLKDLIFTWRGNGSNQNLYHTLLSADDATYHIVSTYDGSTAKLYVNGTLVQSGALPGPLLASTPTALVVGPGSPLTGPDLSLDDPTIWQGYALSEQNILALRDRAAAPEDIAPGNIVWRATLDGTPGAPASLGNPGLDGLGSAGADLVTISDPAPVYEAGPLSYEMSRVRWARIGASGKTLALLVENSAGDLANLTSLTAHPTISVNGGAPIPLANPIWGVGTSTASRLPYVIYPLPLKIAPTDSVTLTAAEGWGVTGTRSLPALDALPVANGPDRSYLPPFVAEPKTMAVGWNPQHLTYYNPVMSYANVAKQSTAFAWNGGTFTIDADGYPTGTTSGTPGSRITSYIRYAPGGENAPLGWPDGPSGAWTVKWDGTADVELQAIPAVTGTTTVSLQAEMLTGGADNVRVYQVARDGPHYFQAFELSVRGPAEPHGLIQVSNIRVYPPGVATDGSQKFHPEYLRMLAGARSIRFMRMMRTNQSDVAEYEHLSRETWYSYGASTIGPSTQSPVATITASVVSIGTYDNAAGIFDPTDRYPFLLTTAEPHGFSSGQFVNFSGLPLIPRSDGQMLDLNSFASLVYRISDTTLALGVRAEPEGFVEQAVTATAVCRPYAGMPLADMVDLCNQVGADPWLCVPHGMSDAGVTSMATEIVARLAPGLKCRIEYSNETWNLGTGFSQFFFFEGMGRSEGLGGAQWYAKRAGEVHALCAAAFAAAGRAGDLVRVFGTQGGGSSRAALIIDYCVANGIPVDELAIAPYLVNGPFHANLAATWAAMDVEQLLDTTEMYVQHHYFYAKAPADNRAILQAAYPNANLVTYEGGTELGVPYGENSSALTKAWGRHPRMRHIVLGYLQQLQNQGCTLFNWYELNGVTATSNITVADVGIVPQAMMWSAYTAWNQKAGLGDGSDGQFDNRTNYEALDRIVSVVGGAMDTWEALVSGPLPPEPTPPGPGLRRPRPLLRGSNTPKSQQPRGLFRPTGIPGRPSGRSRGLR